MQYLGYLLLGILLAFLFFQWRVVRQAKKLEGQAAPELDPRIDAALKEHGRAVLYFHSPSCGPCKMMTPMVESAAADRQDIFPIDIRQSTDVARKLGVMATPTIVVLADGQVSRIVIGAQSPTALAKLLG